MRRLWAYLFDMHNYGVSLASTPSATTSLHKERGSGPCTFGLAMIWALVKMLWIQQACLKWKKIIYAPISCRIQNMHLVQDDSQIQIVPIVTFLRNFGVCINVKVKDVQVKILWVNEWLHRSSPPHSCWLWCLEKLINLKNIGNFFSICGFLVFMLVFTSNHTPPKYKRMHVLICCFLNQTPIFDSWYNEMKEQTPKDTRVKMMDKYFKLNLRLHSQQWTQLGWLVWSLKESTDMHF